MKSRIPRSTRAWSFLAVTLGALAFAGAAKAGGFRGDCNDDGQVSPIDLSGFQLEYFDGDGLLATDTQVVVPYQGQALTQMTPTVSWILRSPTSQSPKRSVKA